MIRDAVIVITGASSGMGEAAARYLAARGAKLVLGARNDGKLRTVAEEIRAAGGDVTYHKTDVVSLQDNQDLAAHAIDTFGRLDVFVANAGSMPIGPMDELRVDDWNRMIDVNIKGVRWGIAAALPIFRGQKAGTSLWSRRPQQGRSCRTWRSMPAPRLRL